MAASRKTEKYSSLFSTYMFEPITIENLGALSRQRWTPLLNWAPVEFLLSLAMSETSYLLQRISVAIQRFNSMLLHDSLTADIPDLSSIFMAALAALWNGAGHYTFALWFLLLLSSSTVLNSL